MTTPANTLPQGTAWMLMVGLLFGNSIVYSRGAYSEPAIVMVLMAVLTLMARWSTQLARAEKPDLGSMLAPLAWVGFFGMAWFSFSDREVIIYPVKQFEQGRMGQMALLALLLTYVPFLTGRWVEPRWARLGRFLLVGLAVAVAARDVLKSSPTPFIDVWTVQQGGADALLHGHNPYVAVAVQDTGSGKTDPVPYVYPPLQILLTLPAYWLGHDVRYTMVFALLLTGVLLRAIVRRSGWRFPSIVEDGPALLIWTMPKLMFIIEQSWVDPVQVMLISAAAVTVLSKRPVLIAIAFGVVLTSKQTMFWTVGLAGVLLRFTWRQWLIVGAVGAASVLPFAIADFPRLKFSLLDFVSSLPDRPDALTFNVWGVHHLGWLLPTKFGFVFAAVVAGVSAWRLPRTLHHWALGSVATFAIFFAFNKWAFANYYFLLGALSALAAACATHAFKASAPNAG